MEIAPSWRRYRLVAVVGWIVGGSNAVAVVAESGNGRSQWETSLMINVLTRWEVLRLPLQPQLHN